MSKNMKFICVFIAILLILNIQPVTSVELPSSTNPGEIEVVKYHQFIITSAAPINFYPSDIRTINITVQNVYNYSAYSVSTVIDESKADPLKFTDQLHKYIGNEIKAKNSFTVQYDVYIKDNVLKGIYYIPLTVLWSVQEGGTVQRQEDLLIGIIVTENPEVIKIDTINITTIPEHIKSGDEFKLKVLLKNIGNSRLNQIRAALDVKAPFSSVGSSTEQYISVLEPDQSAEVIFNLRLDKQAASRLYNFNFTLDYKDYSNRQQSQSGSFGINAEEISEVYIQDVTLDPTTLNPDSEGLLMVQIANAGTNEVKNVRVTIFGGDKILTQSQNFIGIIQPGPRASETTSFGVKVAHDIDIGDYGLKIQINYDDVNGIHESKSSLYIVKIIDSSSIIPVSPEIMNEIVYDILYLFIFIVMSYGIFLIVASGRVKGSEKKESKKLLTIFILIIYLILLVPYIITSNAGESGVVIENQRMDVHSIPNDIQDLLIYKNNSYNAILIEDPVTNVEKLEGKSAKERKVIISTESQEKGTFVRIDGITTDIYVTSYNIIDQPFDKMIIGDAKKAKFADVIGSINNELENLNKYFSDDIFDISQIVGISQLDFYIGGLLVVLILSFLFHRMFAIWNIPAIATLYSFQFFLTIIVEFLNKMKIEKSILIFGFMFILMLPLTLWMKRFEESENGKQKIFRLYAKNKEIFSKIKKKLGM